MTYPVLTASVVGGGMGGRLSLDALLRSPHFRLVAAADLRTETRSLLEHDYPDLRTYATHEEMLRDSPTDVVCVSTYPPTHEEVTLATLATPAVKGLLVEKPLGDTAASGRRLLEAIQKKALPVVVPHGLRTRANSSAILEAIGNGAIGELKLIEVQNDKWDLLNAGIHWLDFCLAATGGAPVSSVLATCDTSTRTYRDSMQVETVAVTYVENADRVRFVVQTGDFINVNREGKGTLFRIVGTKGLIEFWGWEGAHYILNAQHPEGEIVTPPELPVTGHQLHLERLADQIHAGRADYSAAQASLLALEIIEAAFLSSRHRCQVKFPLEDFVPPSASDWLPGKPYSGADGGRDGRKL